MREELIPPVLLDDTQQQLVTIPKDLEIQTALFKLGLRKCLAPME